MLEKLKKINSEILPHHLIPLPLQFVHCCKQNSLGTDKTLCMPDWLPHTHILWNGMEFLIHMSSTQVSGFSLVQAAARVEV